MTQTNDNTLIKPTKLIDEKGTYKEKASITEIGKCLAEELNINREKAILTIFSATLNGYIKMPSRSIDSKYLYLNKKSIYTSDLQGYVSNLESYINEKLIRECPNYTDTDFSKIVEYFASEAFNKSNQFHSLNSFEFFYNLAIEHGKLILPDYQYDAVPLDISKQDNGVLNFIDWFNQLPDEIKLFFKSVQFNEDEIPPKEHFKNLTIPVSVTQELMRSFHKGFNRRSRLYMNVRDRTLPIPLTIEEQNYSFEEIIDNHGERYLSEVESFKLTLAGSIYLTRKSVLRWLRRGGIQNYYSDYKGCPTFWGNPWENQPESWEYGSEDVSKYYLYNSIYYWSDAEDISELEELENWAMQSQRALRMEDTVFAPLQGDELIKGNVIKHTAYLKDVIYPRFLNHFEEKRLEMWGRDNNRQKVKIEADEIKDYLTCGKFDFENSEIPHIGITGIEVCKVDKRKQQKNLKVTDPKQRRNGLARYRKLITDEIRCIPIIEDKETFDIYMLKFNDLHRGAAAYAKENDFIDWHKIDTLGDFPRVQSINPYDDKIKSMATFAAKKIDEILDEDKKNNSYKNDSETQRYFVPTTPENFLNESDLDNQDADDLHKINNKNDIAIPKAKLKQPLGKNTSAHTSAYREAYIVLGLEASTNDVMLYLQQNQNKYPVFIEIKLSSHIKRRLPTGEPKTDNLRAIRKALDKVKDSLQPA